MRKTQFCQCNCGCLSAFRQNKPSWSSISVSLSHCQYKLRTSVKRWIPRHLSDSQSKAIILKRFWLWFVIFTYFWDPCSCLVGDHLQLEYLQYVSACRHVGPYCWDVSAKHWGLKVVLEPGDGIWRWTNNVVELFEDSFRQGRIARTDLNVGGLTSS